MSQGFFARTFHGQPHATALAQGRANLIGEHTDYNDGFVLPFLLPLATDVSLRFTDDGRISGASERFGSHQASVESEPDGTWLDVVRGALHAMKQRGFHGNGLEIAVESSLPSGAGVSSSAALAIGTLRALGEWFSYVWEPTDLARSAQAIEHHYIGTKCGIMDPLVIAQGSLGHALCIDCRHLTSEPVVLPSSLVFAVIHSGSERKLSSGAYNERRAECQAAATAMNLASLRDATLHDLSSIRDPIPRKRALHVLEENQRVHEAVTALRHGNGSDLGALMNASHISLRDHYDASSDVLDTLVESCRANNALGARLTGAGFGGCVVALFDAKDANQRIHDVLDQQPNARLIGKV